MTFQLKNVVPWGRTLNEYKNMFNLTDEDINKNIVSFGDGPASFNTEMNELQKSVTSIDPIYQFSTSQIKLRIEETRTIVMQQVVKNKFNFSWSSIKNPKALEKMRLNAMSNFLLDFKTGKEQNRYIFHSLPQQTQFKDDTFELGLSSHFLVLYDNLGIEFHINSITEMLRICKEVRIFPLLNLNSEKSNVLDDIISFFESNYTISIEKVAYEFQKGGNKMMRIYPKAS